jgi:hypothetical protein
VPGSMGGGRKRALLLGSGASCKILRRHSSACEAAGVDDSEEGGVLSSRGGVIGLISRVGRGDIDLREDDESSEDVRLWDIRLRPIVLPPSEEWKSWGALLRKEDDRPGRIPN